ncbi:MULTISPECIES: M48 family metalloprotease [unclassified Rhodococcus (in: high G+C Gram-positive bacteria)]|uniref:M56 family metallopeptidase n=1 Tax=Rhodococcus sp. SJ-3 TaxID=3454628 RepID=UPI003F79748F
MTLALVLLLGAALISIAAPRMLARLAGTSLPPGVLLAAWLGSLGGALFLGASAVVTLAWPDHAPAEAAVEAVVRCFTAMSHAVQPWITETMAAVGALGLLAVVVRAVILGRRYAREQARLRTYHRDVVAIVARSRDDDVMWLAHPMPMAYSVAGRPGFVVATDGLSDFLTTGERDAVLAHERAHLRGGHHLIVTTCDILAAVFPVVPLFASAPSAVKTLVELTADQHAAHATSTATVCSALTVVSASTLSQPAGTLGLSNETTLRLRTLNLSWRTRWPRLSYATAAALSVTMPMATALAGLAVVSASVCLVATTV